MDKLGYDGVGLNEHHTTPHGLMNSPNMMAAVGAQRTKKLKFFILGNLLPLHNPLRIAEELSMADNLSRGRIMSGFARGVPREYKVYDVPMADSRARFDEALEVIQRAWKEDVFSHEGKFWKFKDISIWPRPYQDPHPPIWIPFTGSKETIECAAAGNFGAAIHHPHPGVVNDMIAYFGKKLAESGHSINPDQICTMTEAWVADSGAQAMDQYGPYFMYFNNVLWHHGGNPPGQKANPVAAGYVKSSSYDYVRPENAHAAVIDREVFRKLNREDVETKVASGELAFGNAKEVTERLIEQAEAVGANKMLINVNFGAMPNDLFMEQVRRFGREVLPKLQAHQVKRIPAMEMAS
jgi:alkanesulfonate monooxygenase SsuD/methylene tetrahydromethanopterin reductase-like flavin-dependent oxidoreductase (luciferase family)